MLVCVHKFYQRKIANLIKIFFVYVREKMIGKKIERKRGRKAKKKKKKIKLKLNPAYCS